VPFILPDKAEAFINHNRLIPCQWGEFVDPITNQRFTSPKTHKLRKFCKHTNEHLPLGPVTHLTYSIGLTLTKENVK
jgi:hypothetical protein